MNEGLGTQPLNNVDVARENRIAILAAFYSPGPKPEHLQRCLVVFANGRYLKMSWGKNDFRLS